MPGIMISYEHIVKALVEAIRKGDRDITQAIEISAGGGRVGMSLIGIEVLPVDDISLPRDTRLILGGGLPTVSVALSIAFMRRFRIPRCVCFWRMLNR